jgi:hypothetical protein
MLRACVAVLLLIAGPAEGAPVLATFEGLSSFEGVRDFYNGGTGSFGSIGPNIGLRFNNGSNLSEGSIASIDSDCGGSGNFGGEASSCTVLFVNPSATTLPFFEVSAGFINSLSFYYVSPGQAQSISIYDGLGASGTVLAQYSLPITPTTAARLDPTGVFGPFFLFEAGFSGVARSVAFNQGGGLLLIDDLAFSVVPEPSSGCLVVLALSLAALRHPRHVARRPTRRIWSPLSREI